MTRPTATDPARGERGATHHNAVAGRAVRTRPVREAMARPGQGLSRSAPPDHTALTFHLSLPWRIGIALYAALASLTMVAVGLLALYQPWYWHAHMGLLCLLLFLGLLGLCLRALAPWLTPVAPGSSIPRLVPRGLMVGSWLLAASPYALGYQRVSTETLGLNYGTRSPLCYWRFSCSWGSSRSPFTARW